VNEPIETIETIIESKAIDIAANRASLVVCLIIMSLLFVSWWAMFRLADKTNCRIGGENGFTVWLAGNITLTIGILTWFFIVLYNTLRYFFQTII